MCALPARNTGRSPLKPLLFSGIQPSGEIHIGNYCGAIRNWVHLLDRYDGIFCVVDYHSITVSHDVSSLRQRILDAARVNIACGLDPERCTLFVQSHVPEHTELAWVLSSVTPMGDLTRMTQFKEKSRQHEDNINAGLFTYPVLQAADILLYKAVAVPVGEDQIQHIELAREVARKFNARFGPVFPEPAQLVPQDGARIMGLDGVSKMSKSLGNYVGVLDSSEQVWTKLAPAKTDENRKRRSDPGDPDVCNVFTLHKSFSGPETVTLVNRECRIAGIGCIDCKKMLHQSMMATLQPIQEKAAELAGRPGYVEDVLAQGAAQASQRAKKTMEEVRSAIGIR
jgi:tryptophanyl-tRNA synthetase